MQATVVRTLAEQKKPFSLPRHQTELFLASSVLLSFLLVPRFLAIHVAYYAEQRTTIQVKH